ncbi:MAG TPA: ABC transporter permease [Candidatus Acidoferrales bacterium]|nr:ABC transporter permease [Candidatus Acidoferrales bacterium]
MATRQASVSVAPALRLRSMARGRAVSELREAVSLAMDALRRNPMRSALTILGIVIGITAVIAVSAVISGINGNVLGSINDLGSDTIICYRFPWASLSRPPSEWLLRKELQAEWADDIAQLPHVAAASPSLRIFLPQFGSGSVDVHRGGYRAKNVILQGNSPDINKIFDLKIARGRWFTLVDQEHRAPIVVLGFDAAKTLFPDPGGDPIGKEVVIQGQLFTVVGTAEKRRQGLSAGSNPEDNIAIFPLSTLHKMFPNQKDYVIFVKAKTPEMVTEAVEETRDLLRRKRRLSSNQPDNFAIFTPDYFLELWKQISTLVFVLMFAVASVGLVVGGIGVMNIMLVSVTERTREIGVRKAIGAKRRNILMQFLLEAVTLSGIGGVLGVLLGGGIALLVRALISLPAQLSLFWVLTALIVCAMIGIGFGIYPAWKAARLDPVDALRYE